MAVISWSGTGKQSSTFTKGDSVKIGVLSAASVRIVLLGNELSLIGADGSLVISGITAADLATLELSFADGTLFHYPSFNAAGTTAPVYILGSAGAEILSGGFGNDVVDGGAGNDIISGAGGADHLFGGDGDDQISAQHRYDSASRSWLPNSDNGAVLDGGNGDDILRGSDGSDSLDGGAGNDSLSGNGGDDSLFGGAGADALDGGAGNDKLDGGSGADRMAGGAGDDSYVIDNLYDLIVESGKDKDSALVKVDWYKTNPNVANWTFAPGVQRLPYWIDDLSFYIAGAPLGSGLNAGGVVHYYFAQTTLAGFSDADKLDFSPFNAAQIAATRAVLAYASSLFKVSFVEASNADSPYTIVFGANEQTASSGYASTVNNRGYSTLMLDKSKSNLDPSSDLGGAITSTLLHELGHALGLKHPFSHPDALGKIGEAPFLSDAEDKRSISVMSYTNDITPHQYGPLDLAAMFAMWGINPAVRAGDSTYVLSATHSNFIYDGSGLDRIDGSALQQALSLSLEPGQWSYIGSQASLITAPGQITIDFGSLIEDAYGGAGNDSLIGNSADNRLFGGAGDDVLEGGAGQDRLDGGSGTDTARYAGKQADYQISAANGLITVRDISGALGTDSLSNIELIQFADGIYRTGLGSDLGAGLDQAWNASASLALASAPSGRILVSGASAASLQFSETGGRWIFSTGKTSLSLPLNAAGPGSLHLVFDDGSHWLSATGAAAPDDMPTVLLGTSGNDELFGAGGADRLEGGSGDDALDGGAGDDTLYGGAGDDLLFGGSGLDTVVYAGARADYLITGTSTAVSVTDRLGREGSDRLSGIETLVFSDRIVRLDSAGRLSEDMRWDSASSLSLSVGARDTLSITGATLATLQVREQDGLLVLSVGKNQLILSMAEGRSSFSNLAISLDGGAILRPGSGGADSLTGSAGADGYLINNTRDRISDSGGEDTAFVSVDFYKTYANVEHWNFATGVRQLPYWVDGLLFAGGATVGGGYASAGLLHYAFAAQAPSFASSAQSSNFVAMNTAQMNAVRSILSSMSALLNLRFEESSDVNAAGTLVFGGDKSTTGFGTVSGYNSSHGPLITVNSTPAGLAPDLDGANIFSASIMFQIEYGLGLARSFTRGSASSAIGPVFSASEDSNANTWMASIYNGKYSAGLGPLDVAALQAVYGVAPQANAGDSVFTLKETAANFIYDGAGTDTIDGSALTAPLNLSLETGVWSYIGSAAGAQITAPGQITINIGSQIENAKGGAGNDQLRGNELANLLKGGAGNDSLAGLGGDDRLHGGAGNDLLDGGSGLDVALYDGVRSVYQITHTGTVYVVSGPDGSDSLVNIERLQFADSTVTFDTGGIVGQTYRIYQAAFDRTPDLAGLGYWMSRAEAGMSLRQLAQAFIGSAEFADLYGAKPSNGEFLTKLYNNILHRTPDPAGYAYWLTALDAGAPRDDVLVQFSESTENVSLTGVAIGNGIAYLPWL